MNEHYEISKEKLLQEIARTETNTKGSETFVESVRETGLFIEHLSSEKYECYLHDGFSIIYFFYNKEKETVGIVYRKNIKPESVRERLHNIETAKEFYAQRK